MTEAIGYLAIIIGLSGYYYTDPRSIMKIGLLAGVLWIFYFAFLGLWIATITSVLGLIRQISAVYMNDKNMYAISLITLFMIIPVILLNNLAWVSLLPVLVAISVTISVWFRDYPIKFRIIRVATELTFLLFAVLTGAQALAVSAILVIIVNIATALMIVKRQPAFLSSLKIRPFMFSLRLRARL